MRVLGGASRVIARPAKGGHVNESDKETSKGKSETMEKAKALGLYYGSQGMLIGLFLCNPVVGVVVGALGYGLGMLVGRAKENSNSGK
jgi:uncharacterized membrane protein